jgi:hypothetical protein
LPALALLALVLGTLKTVGGFRKVRIRGREGGREGGRGRKDGLSLATLGLREVRRER